ncbi:MAG: MarC family protein [Saprospiraceae bacterium]|nr:MarC family protein [Saprospiraceae bacterium]
MELLKTFFFFFAVIDPIGAIPIFLEATKSFDDAAKKKIAVRASIIAALVLFVFIVVGQIIMDFMHISLSAFQISGGIILFLFALTMVFGHGKAEDDAYLLKDSSHITIFPVAMPGIASPGAIMAVVLATDNYTFNIQQQFFTTIMVLLVLVVTCLLLIAARKVQSIFGESGIIVITKIMGLLIASYAVQSVLTGIKEYFKL